MSKTLASVTIWARVGGMGIGRKVHMRKFYSQRSFYLPDTYSKSNEGGGIKTIIVTSYVCTRQIKRKFYPY